MKKLVRILPFMDNEEIKELAYEIINGEVEGVKLVMLYPFLKNEDLDEIVDLLIEKKDNKSLQHALPFASKATVNKIYEAVQAGDLEGIKETVFYPFLGKNQLKSMFKTLVKQAKDSKEDVHVFIEKDEEELDEFDIDLEEEENIIEMEMKALQEEMKKLKQKLKEQKNKTE